MPTEEQIEDVFWASALASVLERNVMLRLEHGGVRGLLGMVEFLRDSADIIEEQAMAIAEDDRCQSSQSP